MLPVVDSHCHLDFEDFHEDLPAVLERARAAGIVAMVCVGSGGDLATAERAAALAAQERDVFAAVGIHPHDAGKILPDFWPALEKLAQEPRVVGIGEPDSTISTITRPGRCSARSSCAFLASPRRPIFP